MPTGSDRARTRPSSHIRLSSTGTLYLRLRSAETIVLRRLSQLAAVEARLAADGIAPPAREILGTPTHPDIPSQFAAGAEMKRARSTRIVREAISVLKRTTCRARSPGKREIARMSRDRRIDPEGVGVSINVFRTNQDCLDLYIEACLPFDASRRRKVATPSWAVRMEHDALVVLVLDAERARDQLTRDLMTANELLIAPQVARIRRDVAQSRADRIMEAAAQA